jgi:hypothetical protein
MLKKIDLLRSATALCLAMGTLTMPLARVDAEPSLPAVNGQPNPTTPPTVTTPPAKTTAPAVTPPPTTGTVAPTPAPSTPAPNAATPAKKPDGKIVTVTVSGKAEMAFAEYLAAKDIKFYGAYWCIHCQEQKTLFGAAAAAKLLYIECDRNGENSQRQLCKDLNIQYFPTWVIDGKYYTGSKELKELAKMTGYKGSTKFKYKKEKK